MLALRDVMTAEVETVRPEESLKEVAVRLAQLQVGGFPVVDGCDRPLGVVTRADVLRDWRLVDRRRGKRLRRRNRGSGRRDGAPALVEEAMSAPAITVESTAELSSVLDRMHEYGINRLPVVENGTVVGIVTRHDLVCACLRDDAELADEIKGTVLAGLSWPDAVTMKIEQGHVTVSGQVDTLDDARLLPATIRRILGVTGVDAELTAWDAHNDGPVVVSSHF